MFFNRRFVLASSSNSRYKMLKNVGLVFEKKNPKCNEDILKKKLLEEKKTPKKISLELARLKAKSISSFSKNKIVVGSDTVIELSNTLLNKAKDMKEAKKKIKKMSNKTHKIYSSASVFFNNKELWSSTGLTYVTIRKINEEEIEKYLKFVGKGALSAVGCYQLERGGPNIIKEIKGDYFNVLGFPLFPFLNFLYKQK